MNQDIQERRSKEYSVASKQPPPYIAPAEPSLVEAPRLVPMGEEVRPTHTHVSNPKEKTRLQIDLDATQLSRVDELMAVCNFSSKKEMFDYGVTILEWAAKHSRNGRVIGAIDPVSDSYIELEMPPLANARRASAKVEEPVDAGRNIGSTNR